MSEDTTDLNAVELATELTIAWLGNPNTRSSADDVPAFLGKMHETVSALLGSSNEPVPTETATEYTPGHRHSISEQLVEYWDTVGPVAFGFWQPVKQGKNHFE